MASLAKITLSGGLGNQLSIFSAGLIKATGLGLEPVLDLHWYSGLQRGALLPFHRRKFELTEFSPEVCNLRKTWTPSFTNRIRPGFTGPPIVIDDWPRTFEFFQAERHLLLNTLSPDPQEELARETYLSKISGPGKKSLAIHVRLGDNIHPKTPNPVLGPSYFQEALQFFPHDEFTPIVFSDSPKICSTWEGFENAVFVNEPRAHRALRLMSLADGFIGSLSTFSWWAAWLPSSGGQKSVVMPSVKLVKEFEGWRHFYDPLWKTLDGGKHILS